MSFSRGPYFYPGFFASYLRSYSFFLLEAGVGGSFDVSARAARTVTTCVTGLLGLITTGSGAAGLLIASFMRLMTTTCGELFIVISSRLVVSFVAL